MAVKRSCVHCGAFVSPSKLWNTPSGKWCFGCKSGEDERYTRDDRYPDGKFTRLPKYMVAQIEWRNY